MAYNSKYKGKQIDDAVDLVLESPKISRPITQAEYDAMAEAGTLEDMYYMIKEEE